MNALAETKRPWIILFVVSAVLMALYATTAYGQEPSPEPVPTPPQDEVSSSDDDDGEGASGAEGGGVRPRHGECDEMPELCDDLPTPPPTSKPKPTSTPTPGSGEECEAFGICDDPTSTPIPPTDTPIPPTSTPIPPTDTPIPPTDTPIPPTDPPDPEPMDTPTPAPAKPSAPTGVSAIPIGQTIIDVRWNRVTGAARYEVQWNTSSSGSSWSKKVVDAPGRYYRVTGLTCDTVYYFQVRAFGNGTTIPAAWSDLSSQDNTPTGPCPPPQVKGVTASADSDTRITVEWSSLDRVDRYRIQRKLSGGQWSTVRTAVTVTSYTDEGLSCGTTYTYRVAARGDGSINPRDVAPRYATEWGPYSASVSATTDECEPDPTPISSTPTPPLTVTIARKSSAPAQVVEGGEVRFTLTASSAPSANLTVNVGVTEAGTFLIRSQHTPPSTITIAGGDTTADLILQTDNDAVDEANGTITAEVETGTGYTVGSPSSASVTVQDNDVKLATPTDLTITPLPLRKAELSWTPVSGPGNIIYDVQVRKGLSGPWRDAKTGTPDTNYEINLDAISGSSGFAEATTFGLHVRARQAGNSSFNSSYSEEVIIIDNPILTGGSANGLSAGGDQAVLTWNRILDAGNGYTIRYRELGSRPDFLSTQHQLPAWPGHEDWPYPSGFVDHPTVPQPSTGTKVSTTVRGLSPDPLYAGQGQLHAFQVNYETSTGVKVFSARDAFVWPSNDFPGSGKRVATYPFFGHHEGRSFEYHFCESFFPLDHRSTWKSIIEGAFGQWQRATDGLITIRKLSDRCPTLSNMELFIMQDDERSEVRMLDPQMGAGVWSFPEVKSDAFKGLCVTRAPACVTSFTGYTGIGYDHEIRRLILELLEDNDLSLGEFADIRALLEDHSRDRKTENKLQSVDVTFNAEKFQLPNSRDARSGDLHIPGRVRFNTCLDPVYPDDKDPDRGYKAYKVAVHEAGHALGLANIALDRLSLAIDLLDRLYIVAHPTIPDSAMSYDSRAPRWTSSPFNEPDCSPHPLDVMAIYALYQKVSR